MASLQLSLPSTYRVRPRPVRCADERQTLFNRIAPVYDNVHPLHSISSFFLECISLFYGFSVCFEFSNFFENIAVE